MPGHEEIAHDDVEALIRAEQMIASVGEEKRDTRILEHARVLLPEGAGQPEHAREQLHRDRAPIEGCDWIELRLIPVATPMKATSRGSPWSASASSPWLRWTSTPELAPSGSGRSG